MVSGDTFDAALMDEIRGRFRHIDADPWSGPRVFFENAGGTLRLSSVSEVTTALSLLPDNTGRRNPASRAYDRAIASGRRDVALLLGATSGSIIADQSATGMLFRLVHAVAGAVKGTNLVTTALDHAASISANAAAAAQYGLECRLAGFEPATAHVTPETVLSKIDRGTVCLTLIHTSNILGSRNDVAAIAAAARRVRPDLFIIVDGAQQASHGHVDVAAYGADAWLFVPYKLYSKAGVSFAWVTPRLAELPHEQLQGKPRDAWDLGTRDASAYACMSAVAAYFQWLGSRFTDSADARTCIAAAMAAMEAHEATLLRGLMNGTGGARGMAQMPHVTVYGDKADAAAQTPIVAFNVAGRNTAAVVDYFEANDVRLHDRLADAYSKHTLDALGIDACVRVSLCHYNTIEEVRVFLDLLSRINA